MNQIAPTPEPAIRDIPLCRLALAPENVRRTPPDAAADAQLRASIAAHGLLENLVARADEPDTDGVERYAVVAGGRRLAALKTLAEEGALLADRSVPCLIAANGDAGELSLAENIVRIAMHPADQVVAFSELLDAYRADEIDIETLKAFAVTTDHDRQRAVWERVSAQAHRPSAWQVKRLLTEERVPTGSPVARFVGIAAYEAAGGPVLRDLFADELATRWKWAEAMVEVDWSATARFGRIHPEPAEPMDEEKTEIEKLRTRHDELVNIDDDDWTEELVEEAEGIKARLDAIEAEVETRATFTAEDLRVAGCIATIGRDGTLQVIQGLVKPEDLPKETGAKSNGHDADAGNDGGGETAASPRVDGPAVTTPSAPPPDPRAKAREEAGVGIGLADDLRAIRTTLVKARLAGDFEAAFDLVVFQMVRAVFARGYTGSWHALDIAFNETADRPAMRMNDDDFAAWSPGEAMLADWSHLPFEWMEGNDDAACFAALRALPRADKETLFAAAVARTVKGQLAFEHDARPELEATVARLDIDFAKHVRPTADMLWSRIRKGRILDAARQTLGAAWASARSKYKKAGLARAMEEAFAAGTPPVGIGATTQAAPAAKPAQTPDTPAGGETLDRRAFLDGALHVERWRGLVFGAFKDRWNGFGLNDPDVNFHGLTVSAQLPRVESVTGECWTAGADIVDCPDLELVLPARKEPVETPFLEEMREAARLAIYRAMAADPDPRPSFADRKRAYEADIDIAAPPPVCARQLSRAGAHRPDRGVGRILDIDADVAFAGDAWSWVGDALPLVTAGSDIEPFQLMELLRAAFFSASDDADADSWEHQRDVFEQEALHIATRLLVSDDAARRSSIAEAVTRELFWLIPHDRGAEISVRDRKVTVTLGVPAAQAAAGG